MFKRFEGTYTPNTIKSYYADVTHFVDWSQKEGIHSFLLSDAHLTVLIEALKFSHRYTTICRKLVALKKINKLLGYPDV